MTAIAADGRILALDYGGRRIGVAVSDPTRTIAQGRPTLLVRGFDDAVRQVLELFGEGDVACVVLGLPLTLRGDEGDIARTVRRFAAALVRHQTPPVVFLDERLTSAQATKALHAMGRRGDKGAVDQTAAMLLLQTALATQVWNRAAAGESA